MEHNNINGAAKSPQTKDLLPVLGQKQATAWVKTCNEWGKNRQQTVQKQATNAEGVKTGNYEQGVIPQEWLYNPVVYSQVSGDFSLLQQRILSGVLSKMQDRILYTINEKEQNKRFPSLFTEEEMGDVFQLDIDPLSLGITPDHYGDLEDALNALTKLTMAFPKYIKGEMHYVIAPLFARIEVPRGETRRTGRFHIYMLRKNAEDFFSLAHGYTVHLARITQLAKKKRTPRIYIFLSSFRDVGHKEIEYHAFCKFLGIDQETFDADNKVAGRHVKENPFRKFNKVRSQILEPTKQELDLFMGRGEIDFSFNYEPLYKYGKMHGNPTHIRFTIVKGTLALERDVITTWRRKTMVFANTMCNWCGDLHRQDLMNLCVSVSQSYLDSFLDYGYREVRKLVEKRQPDDVATYTMQLLSKKAEEHNRNMAEIRVQQIREQWERCRAYMLSQCTRENSFRIITSLTFESWEEETKTLMLRLDSYEDYKWIVQPHVTGELVKPAIVRHFGTDICWMYSVPRSTI